MKTSFTFSLRPLIGLLCLLFFPLSGFTQLKTFFNYTSNYEAMTTDGWVFQGVTIASDRFSLSHWDGSVSSPEMTPAKDLRLTFDYTSAGTWPTGGIVKIISVATGDILKTSEPFEDTGNNKVFINNDYEIAFGDISEKYTILLEPKWANEKLQIRNFKLTGIATSSELEIMDQSLDFGLVKIGQSLEKKIQVTPYNLTENINLSVQGTGFTITPAIIAPSQNTVPTTLTITFMPETEGLHEGKILFSGSGIDKNISLQGNGLSKNAPIVLTSISSLDFGTVSEGGNRKLSFIITPSNLKDDLTISSDNELFSVEPAVVPVGAASQQITVTFSPLSNGEYTGNILFNSTNLIAANVALKAQCAAAGETPLSVAQAQNTPDEATASVTGYIVGYMDGSYAYHDEDSRFGNKNLLIADEPVEKNLSPSLEKGKMFYIPLDASEQGEGDTFWSLGKNFDRLFGKKIMVTGVIETSGTTKYMKGMDALKRTHIGFYTPVEIKNPSLTTTVSELDFGEVEMNQEKTLTFSVTPTDLAGDIQVISDNPAFVVSPEIIPASTSTAQEITVTYTATGNNEVGHITLASAGINHTLNTFGKNAVVTEIDFGSTVSLDFGKTEVGKISKNSFIVLPLKVSGDISLEIEGDNAQAFEVNPKLLTAADEGQEVTVTVTYSPSIVQTDNVNLVFSAASNFRHEISLTGMAVAPAVIETDKDLLSFEKVAVGDMKELELTVTVENLIEDVVLSTDNDNYTVTPAIISKNTVGEQIVRVQLTPKSSGLLEGNLKLSYNTTEHIVSLIGTAYNSADIKIDVTALDFADVILDDTKQMKFEITPLEMPGALNLTIDSDINDIFMLNPTMIQTVSVGNPVEITVTFSPKEVKAYSGILNISDTYNFNYKITLDGMGVIVDGIESTKANANIPFGVDGNIHIQAQKGDLISIYSLSGVCLTKTIADEGLNRIPTSEQHVIVVVNNKPYKVQL